MNTCSASFEIGDLIHMYCINYNNDLDFFYGMLLQKKRNMQRLKLEDVRMENVDETYSVELNFLDEFNLSRNGMIKEIKTEFNIIRLCLQEMAALDK